MNFEDYLRVYYREEENWTTKHLLETRMHDGVIRFKIQPLEKDGAVLDFQVSDNVLVEVGSPYVGAPTSGKPYRPTVGSMNPDNTLNRYCACGNENCTTHTKKDEVGMADFNW